jgi:hypothetical protein
MTDDGIVDPGAGVADVCGAGMHAEAVTAIAISSSRQSAVNSRRSTVDSRQPVDCGLSTVELR